MSRQYKAVFEISGREIEWEKENAHISECPYVSFVTCRFKEPNIIFPPDVVSLTFHRCHFDVGCKIWIKSGLTKCDFIECLFEKNAIVHALDVNVMNITRCLFMTEHKRVIHADVFALYYERKNETCGFDVLPIPKDQLIIKDQFISHPMKIFYGCNILIYTTKPISEWLLEALYMYPRMKLVGQQASELQNYPLRRISAVIIFLMTCCKTKNSSPFSCLTKKKYWKICLGFFLEL